GDGLTDKEEIEDYLSNPLKISTSDDLYTDLYKIEHGMDINTYYEYKENKNYIYNECEEIIFEATVPTDFNAVAVDCVGKDTLNGCKVYKQYDVIRQIKCGLLPQIKNNFLRYAEALQSVLFATISAHCFM
ncbi:MAG: hypothetical protein II251_05135, partial [Lachnospiraceae bacterium]|nr:hypothetical protein [Lachnospiraceae bacterium]